MDEHEDDQNQTIKSPIKRYGSTRKIYLYNSEYTHSYVSEWGFDVVNKSWILKNWFHFSDASAGEEFISYGIDFKNNLIKKN
jgi:hypothetical protein